ncbi:MAG TPA: hypothetical protein VIG99_09690 [Myxococcaceae bacterium]|jgi:hypothetical protein
MNRARSILLLLAPAIALTTAAAPAPKKLTLAFSGDNGGEIAPCG